MLRGRAVFLGSKKKKKLKPTRDLYFGVTHPDTTPAAHTLSTERLQRVNKTTAQ